MIYKLQSSNFSFHDNTVFFEGSNLSFIFFYSPKCRWCSKIFPVFKKMVRRFGDKVEFFVFNIEDDNRKIINLYNKTRFNINFVPTFISYMNRKPVALFFPEETNERYYYNVNKDKMLNFMNMIISANPPKSLNSPKKYNNITTNSSSSINNISNTNNIIPEYSLCKPSNCNNRQVCMIYTEAYNNDISSNNTSKK